jgi:GT2 family glycosyltransferase
MQEFGFYSTAKKMKKRMFDFLDENVKKGKPFKVDWVLGACMIMPRKLFVDSGQFDDSFFLYEEEVDLLHRFRNSGFNTYFVPQVKVVHNHNTSTSKLGFAFIRYHGFRSIIIYTNKHERGLRKIYGKLLLTFGITMRYLRGIFIKKYRLGNISSHTALFWDLLVLNITGSGERARAHRHFETTKSALVSKNENSLI